MCVTCVCCFSGSSGEEVLLSYRPLKQDDVENPQVPLAENLHDSLRISTGGDSDGEQDFVSSVVSPQDRPHVHWGDLPKRFDHDEKLEQRRTRSKEGLAVETEHQQIHRTEEENILRDENEGKYHVLNTRQTAQEQDTPEDKHVDETTATINECSLSEKVIPNTQTEDKAPFTGSKHNPSTTLTATSQDGHSPAGLSITQVGMSRRGAAGLRHLLDQPDSVRRNLLEYLRRTLKEWCTEKTLKFLYGDQHSPLSSFADIKEEEEELDEDDLDDDVTTVAGELKRPSAPVPDYELLRRQTQHLALRVRQFYKGSWGLPEEEELNWNQVSPI